MKNIKPITQILFLLYCMLAFAQAPQRMSYQAVVRNASGNLVGNANVGVRISILQGSATGTSVYTETHTTTTNENGLVTLQIGGGNVQSGNFSTINWGSGNYFIETETDPNGGSNYSISGTSQLLSVPYALYAENTKSQGKTSIYLTGDITNQEAADRIAREAGPNTENISILGTTALTTVNLSGFGIKTLMNLIIEGNAALQSMSLNDVTDIYSTVSIKNNAALTTLSFTNYTKASGSFTIYYNNALTTLQLPNLTTIEGTDFSLSMPVITLPSLTKTTNKNGSGNSGVGFSGQTINLPVLTSATYLIIAGQTVQNVNLPSLTTGYLKVTNTSMTNLTLPSLISGSLLIANNSLLTTLSLPVLTTLTSGTISDNSQLSTISFPMLSHIDNSVVAYPNILMQNNALTSTTVNAILHQLLTVTPVYGANLKQYPNASAAPPTGQGIIDKQTLISQGKNILTD